MHSQQLINYFNAIYYLFSLPKKTYLKLCKCNWFERELGKSRVFNGNQKTHMVKSWFLQAQSSEMFEWFQLFQQDTFVFFKVFVCSSSNSKPNFLVPVPKTARYYANASSWILPVHIVLING